MNIKEYEKVKNFTYLEYCDYLQDKYGIGLDDYMYPSYNTKKKVKRTAEGLIAHHKYEDHAILLADPEHAKQNPFEWQLKENIVYCDLLEHLFLHILITEYPSPDANKNEIVGYGGVVNFIVPELNDIYSGYQYKIAWRRNIAEKVIDDLDVYFELVKRFKHNCKVPDFTPMKLCWSYNTLFDPDWSLEKDEEIFIKISNL